jgi:hypothetical protein
MHIAPVHDTPLKALMVAFGGSGAVPLTQLTPSHVSTRAGDGFAVDPPTAVHVEDAVHDTPVR